MEYQLLADGVPITDFERVRAADVELWKKGFQQAGVEITVVSRKVGVQGDPVPDRFDESPSLSLSKAELLRIADAQNLDIPSGATKAQILDRLS